MALVSERVRDELKTLQPDIAEAVDLIVSRPDLVLDAADLSRIRVAFMSLDLIASSTTRKLEPTLKNFFEQLGAAPHLEWLHLASAGADRPAVKELQSRGVRLTTSSGASAMTVSHSALAGFLALARGVPHWIDAQRRHEWAPLQGASSPRDIEGQKAVVVGLGPIGCEIARLLACLGVDVTGIRYTPQPVSGCSAVLSYGELDTVLPQADWLILACPITNETRGLIDGRRLRLLPRGARLINISRGAVVVERELLDALRSDHLAGAYLDVFEEEPLPAASPLWDAPNTIISAHCSAQSSGLHGRTLDMFRANLAQWVTGGPLRNEVAGVRRA